MEKRRRIMMEHSMENRWHVRENIIIRIRATHYHRSGVLLHDDNNNDDPEEKVLLNFNITHLPVLTPVFMLIPPTSTATATVSPAAKMPNPNIFTLDCSHFLVHFYPLLVQVLANNWLLG